MLVNEWYHLPCLAEGTFLSVEWLEGPLSLRSRSESEEEQL